MKQYFEILELQPGATPDEVKTAYRDLAKVWHPDRFKTDSPRLKSKAAEKLAEINDAYEKIRAYQARQKARKQAGETQHPDASNPNYTGYRPYSPDAPSGNGQSYSGYARPTPNGRTQHRRPPNNSTTRSQTNAYRRARTHSASRPQPSGNASASSVNPGASAASQAPFQQPNTPTHTLARRRQTSVQYGGYGNNYAYAYKKRRRATNSMAIYLAAGALLAIVVAGVFFYLQKNNTAPPTLADLKLNPEVAVSAAPDATSEEAPVDAGEEEIFDEEMTPLEAGLITSQRPVNTRKISNLGVPAGYFTIGSPKSAVLAIQGKPEQELHGLLRYGFSSVFFEDDIVIGWHQSRDTQLLVKMVPRKTYEAAFFTRGSTRDEVIAIQGTPDHYRDRGRELRYGESRVTFEKGRVVSWHQHPDTPLAAKLLPATVSTKTHFTFNSTRDEVLSIQGTPTHFGENAFHYGYSTVQFRNDRVIGWNQSASFPLKIDLQPSTPTSTKFFTKGSTRDEVIASQGTPDQYSEQLFKYGHSSISFENERVVSWYESIASPLKVRSE